jgi:NAD(P) transhydrogenase subunit alpha
MKIGVPKESADGERRVALVPDVVKSLKRNEHVDVLVESGSGVASGHPDSQYEEAGAEVVDGEVTWGADVVLRVAVPSAAEIAKLKSGQLLVGHLAPWTSAETNKALAASGVTSFAMEAIPRTTRAQAMDALSSQAAAAGYAATLIAARESGRFFGMMTTAAGTVPRSSPASTSAALPGSRSPRSAAGHWNWTSSPTPRARGAMPAR